MEDLEYEQPDDEAGDGQGLLDAMHMQEKLGQIEHERALSSLSDEDYD